MDLLGQLTEAGLTGRGGAGFSTARKLRAAIDHGADLVVNACDGDRGAMKDGWVVAHRLAEASEGAALVSGRRSTVTWAAHRGSPTAARLAAAGLTVLEVPDRYVSSEETALLSLLHGGLARPMTKVTPFVFGGRDSLGRHIRPTVVLNAETLWRVAQVARQGPTWFRSFGIGDEPGPRLATVTGHVPRPGLLDTAAGGPLAELLDAAGGLPAGASVVLVGGLGGVLLDADQARSATWSDAGLARFGGGVGSGIIEVFDPSRCPLDVVTELVAYAAGESAGQCGPCMFGLPAIAADWRALAADPSPAVLDRLRHRLGLLPGRGACHHPDGIARLVASALRVLAPHLEDHATGVCTAREGSAHVLTR